MNKVYTKIHKHSVLTYDSLALVFVQTQTHSCIHAFMYGQHTHSVAQTTTVTNMNLNHSQPINSNILYQVDTKSQPPSLVPVIFLLLSLSYTCSFDFGAFVHVNGNEHMVPVEVEVVIMAVLHYFPSSFSSSTLSLSLIFKICYM